MSACAPRHSKNGTLISTPYGDDKVVQSDTAKCCHCGRVWQWVPGSGRKRGFCMRCGAMTCGNHACDTCIPEEQQLANLESGKPADHRPIIVGLSPLAK